MDSEKERKNIKFAQVGFYIIGLGIFALCAYDYYKNNDDLILDAIFALIGIGVMLVGYLSQSLVSFLLSQGEEQLSEEKED